MHVYVGFIGMARMREIGIIFHACLKYHFIIAKIMPYLFQREYYESNL